MTRLPATTGLPQWVVSLQHIPGAASAIARLIGSAAGAGAAWIDIATAEGEARAGRIRDDAEGRSVITKAAANALADKIGKDPQLAERAIGHMLGETIIKQENREAVAAIAAETIVQSDDQPSGEEGPSDDWMNVFSTYAERASSDTLRQHWAQILVGQIRKPGSISLQTLQFMSVVDQSAAKLMMTVAPRVAGRALIATPDVAERYSVILDLDGIGFLSSNAATWRLDLGPNGRNILVFKRLALLLEGKPGANVNVNAYVLTNPGRQLLDTIAFDDDVEAIKGIAEFYKTMGISRAWYGPYIRTGSSYKLTSMTEVWPVK